MLLGFEYQPDPTIAAKQKRQIEDEPHQSPMRANGEVIRRNPSNDQLKKRRELARGRKGSLNLWGQNNFVTAGSMDPIAYTYEADYHCPACTEKRFGRGSDGYIAGETDGHFPEDDEGNEVHAVFPTDEWWEPSEPGRQVLTCGTCGREIDEISGDEVDKDGYEASLKTAAPYDDGYRAGKNNDYDARNKFDERYPTPESEDDTYREWMVGWRQGCDERISRDYPDSPIAPSWFDPSAAGETWDDSDEDILGSLTAGMYSGDEDYGDEITSGVDEEDELSASSDEPDEEDYIISDSRDGGSDVGIVGGRFLGNFPDRDAAEQAIAERMRKEQFFPSVWWQSDHGNNHLIERFYDDHRDVLGSKAGAKDSWRCSECGKSNRRGSSTCSECGASYLEDERNDHESKLAIDAIPTGTPDATGICAVCNGPLTHFAFPTQIGAIGEWMHSGTHDIFGGVDHHVATPKVGSKDAAWWETPGGNTRWLNEQKQKRDQYYKNNPDQEPGPGNEGEVEKQATDEAESNLDEGHALQEVEPGSKNDKPMWPWELTDKNPDSGVSDTKTAADDYENGAQDRDIDDDEDDWEPEACYRCNGTGHVPINIASPEDPYYDGPEWGDRECPDCGGSGKERDPEEVAEQRYFYGPSWND